MQIVPRPGISRFTSRRLLLPSYCSGISVPETDQGEDAFVSWTSQNIQFVLCSKETLSLKIAILYRAH